ncbi:MAG TPA: sugar ABC transporter permease [Phototrophicaceae bacterium]|nr:sugar ABC transporter permease [Phototrophicaceae bacterium]
MNPVVHQLELFFSSFGVPEDFLPLMPFLLGIVLLYVLLFGGRFLLMRAGIIKQQTASFYLFISPWLIGFVLFTLGPMIYSVYISLTTWNLMSAPQFVGLKNYIHAAQDPRLGQALIVTFTFALVSVPLNVILSFLVSLLMNVRLRGIFFFRTCFYLPLLVSGVAQAVLLSRLFDPNTGVINSFLRLFGVQGPLWLLDPNWALAAIVIMSLWTVGGNMIIYLAGLQDIPRHLYEAAEIDGANQWQRFRFVTVPQMTPILFFNVVTGLIGALQTFTPGYIFGKGGPNDSLLFYVFYLFQNAFAYFQMGYGSALAWILFIVIMILTWVIFRTSRSWVHYELD